MSVYFVFSAEEFKIWHQKKNRAFSELQTHPNLHSPAGVGRKEGEMTEIKHTQSCRPPFDRTQTGDV